MASSKPSNWESTSTPSAASAGATPSRASDTVISTSPPTMSRLAGQPDDLEAFGGGRLATAPAATSGSPTTATNTSGIASTCARRAGRHPPGGVRLGEADRAIEVAAVAFGSILQAVCMGVSGRGRSTASLMGRSATHRASEPCSKRDHDPRAPRSGRRHPGLRRCCRAGLLHRRRPLFVPRPDRAGHRCPPSWCSTSSSRRTSAGPARAATQAGSDRAWHRSRPRGALHTRRAPGLDRDHTRRAIPSAPSASLPARQGARPARRRALRAARQRNRDGVEYRGELGTDLWALGAWWGAVVAPSWERTVAGSLNAIRTEAERRAHRQS